MKENQLMYFFTSTILEWKHLLAPDRRKQIVADSLRSLVLNKKAVIYGFVIMPNHIHLLWTILAPHAPEDVQRDFHKWTAKQLINDIKATEPESLVKFNVETSDRQFQIWERNALGIPVHSDEMTFQKLKYIHYNPVRERFRRRRVSPSLVRVRWDTVEIGTELIILQFEDK